MAAKETLSAYTQRVLIGSTPQRQLNGLPASYTGPIPISNSAQPVLSDPMLIGSPQQLDTNDNLPYSPGIVETSGLLSKPSVINPDNQQAVGTSAGMKGRAFGNNFLRVMVG